MLIRNLSLCVAFAIFAFGSIATTVVAQESPVNVVASNWKFTPNTLHVHLGAPVTLHLTSSEGVHGIKSDELGIPNTVIMPGKAVDVTFTPKKAGTFVVPCSVVCGAGHPDMKLMVEVVEH
jgi:cytochrome c oxidase subunit 2